MYNNQVQPEPMKSCHTIVDRWPKQLWQGNPCPTDARNKGAWVTVTSLA